MLVWTDGAPPGWVAPDVPVVDTLAAVVRRGRHAARVVVAVDGARAIVGARALRCAFPALDVVVVTRADLPAAWIRELEAVGVASVAADAGARAARAQSGLLAYVDRAGRYAFANEAYGAWVGRAPAELIGRPVATGPPGLTERVAAAMTGVPQSATVQLAPAAIEPRWVEIRCRPDRGPDGEVRGVAVLVEDVDERHRADLALRASEHRFRTLADGSPVAITVTRRGEMLYVNPAFRAAIGIPSHEDIRGMRIVDVAAPEEHARVAENVARRAQGLSVPASYDIVVLRRDGSRLPMRVNSGVIELADGPAILASISDATEQKQFEARSRFLLALDDAVRPLTDPDAIAAVAAERLGTFVEVDRCVYSLAGEGGLVPAGEHLRGLPSVRGGTLDALFGRPFTSAMRQNRPYLLQDLDSISPHATDSRSERARAVLAAPVWAGDRLAACLTIEQRSVRVWRADEVELVRAVAGRVWESVERARVDRALRESEQALREADRRKDQFLATLAHELRNPLAPLTNALRVWPSLAQRDPSRLDGLRALMERQVAQLTHLIDDLLDVSRVSRGKIELRRELVDLADVVRGAREAVDAALEAAGHTLRVSLPPTPVVVDGDRGRLVQVVGNLLQNAAKYTRPGGHVEVAVRLEGEEAVLTVADDGIGIAAEQLATIFEPFVQGDASPARDYGGLGLGLTVVRTLVALHGGSVDARSDGPDRGSVFTVRLPTRAASALPPSTPARGGPLPRRRILVVDDLEASATTLVLVLESLGQDARAVTDGEAALVALHSFPADVVVSDIAMPRMDGYALAARIRAEIVSPPLLVALTGYGQEHDRRRALAAGFDVHLVKPVSEDALRQLLTAP